MYVATKVAPILAHQLKSQHSRKNSQKIEKPKPFPTHKGLANAVWPMSSCNQYSRENLHSHKFGSRFPPIQEWATALPFLYMPSCRVTAKLYINRTNSPLLQMVTLNQFYPVKGGPGIIALPSFLYIQSCRVTASGISLCRISLTNLPLLLLYGWYKSHQFAALAVHRCHFLGNNANNYLKCM